MDELQIEMHLRLGRIMDTAENVMRRIGSGEWAVSIVADGSGYASVQVRNRSIDKCHEGCEYVGAHVFDFFDKDPGGWMLDTLSEAKGYDESESEGD